MTLGASALGTAPLGGPTAAAPAVPAAGTMPYVAVELSLAPPTAEPVWVDIGADMHAVTTGRGRNKELDRYQAGTFRVVLDNASAAYDPTNLSGPYAGHMKPMRRLRVRATYAGVTHPVIDGFIDSIDQEYEGPNVARAIISATDAFKVLAATDLPSSVYAAEVVGDGPAHWWRFDEFGGTTAYDSAGNANLTAVGSPDLGAGPPLAARDPGASALLPTNTDWFTGPKAVSGAPFTVELLFAGDDGLSSGIWLAQYSQVGGSFAYEGFEITRLPGGSVLFNVYNAGSVTATVGVVLPVVDGLTHHLAAVWESSGTMRLYFDGAEVATTSVAAATWANAAYFQVGGYIPGTFDEVATYDRALSAAEIAAHYAAVNTPWDGDLPGARAARIVGLAGGMDAELDTGVTTLQSATLGTSALEHLQKTAESEFGALYVTREGTLRLVARHALRNRPELWTFSDDPVAAGNLPYRSLRPEYSDALIRNEVTISRYEGVAQTVRDEDSIAEYMTKSYVIDGLYHDDDALSRSAAEYLVSEYAQPKRRVTRLVVDPREAVHEAALWPAVLGLELTDEVGLIERPPNLSLSQDSVIEGIAHTIGPETWITTFNLSPAGTDSFWQLGVPGHSELGVTTRLGF